MAIKLKKDVIIDEEVVITGYNNTKLESFLSRVWNNPMAPKAYVALITQTSTGAPSAKVLQNTLGATVTLARTSAGIYTLTCTGAFVSNKTVIDKSPYTNPAGNIIKTELTSANVVTLKTYVSTTLTDGLLADHSVKIEVYN